MEKIIILIVSLIISMTLFSACSNSKLSNNITHKEPIGSTTKEQDIREVAYNQLTPNDKERIKGTWQNSSLSKIILKEEYMRGINDKSYIGKEVYLVDFPTKEIRKPNNMIVYVSIDSQNFLGYGLVE